MASSSSGPYGSTSVPVSKSQDAIRQLLRRHGADHFAMGESATLVEVAFHAHARAVRMRVPVQPQTTAVKTDQETRRVWRILFWLLKTRMEAVDAGVETFEQAFLAHVLDERTDLTVYEAMEQGGALAQLTIGSGS